jgi:hypothetical protein
MKEPNDTFYQSNENNENLCIKCEEEVDEDELNSLKSKGKPAKIAKGKNPESLAAGVGAAS